MSFESIEEAVTLIRGSRRIVVVTGAGISVASGLPMFRGSGPDAIWSQDDLEIATFGYYQRDPAGWWRWFFDRFEGLDEAEPNDAHFALATIESFQVERGGSFLLVTQNIDTLHEQAGSRSFVKIHGTSTAVRCSRVGCPRGAPTGSIPVDEIELDPLRDSLESADQPATEEQEIPQSGANTQSHTSVPACPECGSIIRPHALLFDEYYIEHKDYGFGRAQAAIESADLLIFVGTSFSVGITALALDAARRMATPMISIDPSNGAPANVLAIRMNAEDALPEIAKRLES